MSRLSANLEQRLIKFEKDLEGRFFNGKPIPHVFPISFGGDVSLDPVRLSALPVMIGTNPERAHFLAKEIVKNYPDNADLHYQIWSMFRQLPHNMRIFGTPFLESAIDLDNSIDKVEHGLQYFDDMLTDGQYELAVNALDSMISLLEKTAFTHSILMRRGMIEDIVNNNQTQAQAFFEYALANSPYDLEILTRAGSFYRRQGNLVRARQLLNIASKSIGAPAEAIYEHADVLGRGFGDYESAIRLLLDRISTFGVEPIIAGSLIANMRSAGESLLVTNIGPRLVDHIQGNKFGWFEGDLVSASILAETAKSNIELDLRYNALINLKRSVNIHKFEGNQEDYCNLLGYMKEHGVLDAYLKDEWQDFDAGGSRLLFEAKRAMLRLGDVAAARKLIADAEKLGAKPIDLSAAKSFYHLSEGDFAQAAYLSLKNFLLDSSETLLINKSQFSEIVAYQVQQAGGMDRVLSGIEQSAFEDQNLTRALEKLYVAYIAGGRDIASSIGGSIDTLLKGDGSRLEGVMGPSFPTSKIHEFSDSDLLNRKLIVKKVDQGQSHEIYEVAKQMYTYLSQHNLAHGVAFPIAEPLAVEGGYFHIYELLDKNRFTMDSESFQLLFRTLNQIQFGFAQFYTQNKPADAPDLKRFNYFDNTNRRLISRTGKDPSQYFAFLRDTGAVDEAGYSIQRSFLHTDLHPNNIIGHGTIIDWEDKGDGRIGDPLYDLAHLFATFEMREYEHVLVSNREALRQMVPGFEPRFNLHYMHASLCLHGSALAQSVPLLAQYYAQGAVQMADAAHIDRDILPIDRSFYKSI